MTTLPTIARLPEASKDATKTILALSELQKETKKKLLWSKEYSTQGKILKGWSIREVAYRTESDALPTKARGLFTCGNDVAIRGYDKFFNLFETDATKWEALEKETEGPFELTAKENGCIIFIGAVTPESVVVTSKHSIPSPQDTPLAHGGVGYLWLQKHLASVNKTEADLARWLYDHGITLVAELCDDGFEQHVLAYSKTESGLYLHGINYNTPELKTLPSQVVQQVALYFGLRPIDIIALSDIKDVQAVSEQVTETGMFQGREVEGIVVRCKRHNADFFFKVKSTPYLTYRGYRETTKKLLDVSKDGTITIKTDVKLKNQPQGTEEYIAWLKERVVDHPEWFTRYKQNQGIIAVREQYKTFQANQRLASDLQVGAEELKS